MTDNIVEILKIVNEIIMDGDFFTNLSSFIFKKYDQDKNDRHVIFFAYLQLHKTMANLLTWSVVLAAVVSLASCDGSFQYINFGGKDIVGSPPTNR